MLLLLLLLIELITFDYESLIFIYILLFCLFLSLGSRIVNVDFE